MNDIDSKTALALVEAMREEAARVAAGDSDLLRRQGQVALASFQEQSANLIRKIDAEALIAKVMHAPVAQQSELDAFDVAAGQASFNTMRQDDGSFLHPITARAFTVWRAGVRFGQGNSK